MYKFVYRREREEEKRIIDKFNKAITTRFDWKWSDSERERERKGGREEKGIRKLNIQLMKRKKEENWNKYTDTQKANDESICQDRSERSLPRLIEHQCLPGNDFRVWLNLWKAVERINGCNWSFSSSDTTGNCNWVADGPRNCSSKEGSITMIRMSRRRRTSRKKCIRYRYVMQ